MKGNFDFLKSKGSFNDFSQACIDAEQSMLQSYSTTAILCRRALELSVRWVYVVDEDLHAPPKTTLSRLVNSEDFKNIVGEGMVVLLKYIISLGNKSVHTNLKVKRDDAMLSLKNLHQFVCWIDYCYSSDYEEIKFNESLFDKTKEENKIIKAEELKRLYEKSEEYNKIITELISENKSLKEELTCRRKQNTENYSFKIDEISEAETRKKFIDEELELAGWKLGKDALEEVEVDGMPNKSKKGYVDYVLYGNNGKPLAIVEAKRANKSPDVAIEQARLYANCLEKQYNQRPIIFITNGFNTYIWDDAAGYPKRRISGFLKKEELQLRVDRRKSLKPFNFTTIDDKITNRYYQKEAIVAVCEAFENKQRKSLIVAGTGTGKTRISVSLVDVLMKHNFVKNVLFLADRRELVKQAKNSFSQLLPDAPICNLLDKDEEPSLARIIFSTYPTMMNAIDDTKNSDGNRLFSPGHMDLIIIDESHRSIYKKYKAIFEYFDANLVGLTATPKDDIDKNTYSVFELENGNPTYAYEYEKAVEDGYLVDYRTIEVQTNIMKNGIRYDELSEAEKELYESTFEYDENVDSEISSEAINNWLFNLDTIDLVLTKLMDEGLKIEGGNKLGKTIIFAKNHRHAAAIVDRFNMLYPQYGGEFARVIDYDTKYVDSIIDDFKQKDKLPQIAVSVDMLDTGIDVPEIVNLVFFKKVKSKTKFWQMIGRGTRLCKDLLGVGMDKQYFLIFDYCSNFDFFRENPKGYEGKEVISLNERLFNIKVDIIKALQDIKYGEYIDYRNSLVDDINQSVKDLNLESFAVKLKAAYVNKYIDKNNLVSLNSSDINELKSHISPLINIYEDDELAKRFDFIMYTIELAKIDDKKPVKAINNVILTAEKLAKLGTIPQVRDQSKVINSIREKSFWDEAGINDLEDVRYAIRDLIQYLEKQTQTIYYTEFEDMVVTEYLGDAMYDVEELTNYKKKVEQYLKQHSDDIAIYKIRNNKKITKKDLETLEDIMWNKLGTESDYEREFGKMPLGQLVRKIVGLDRKAANEAFSEFLNDENLNSNQINFVKLIIDYIVKNGYIEDNRVLTEDPFRSVGNIVQLFDKNSGEIRRLLDVINDIKRNSQEFIEEAL